MHGIISRNQVGRGLYQNSLAVSWHDRCSKHRRVGRVILMITSWLSFVVWEKSRLWLMCVKTDVLHKVSGASIVGLVNRSQVLQWWGKNPSQYSKKNKQKNIMEHPSAYVNAPKSIVHREDCGYCHIYFKILCRGVCHLENSEDLGHRNHPLLTFNVVQSFKFSGLRFLPWCWETRCLLCISCWAIQLKTVDFGSQTPEASVQMKSIL